MYRDLNVGWQTVKFWSWPAGGPEARTSLQTPQALENSLQKQWEIHPVTKTIHQHQIHTQEGRSRLETGLLLSVQEA